MTNKKPRYVDITLAVRLPVDYDGDEPSMQECIEAVEMAISDGTPVDELFEVLDFSLE